jgi:diguanylate cyclase (GGDEF)-like protein/putative nucleotidyltransferase with HDIG domain
MKDSEDSNIKLQILSLEDSPMDSSLIYEYLRENLKQDFQIDTVIKEEEFISAISTKKYDLILSDFMLPNFDGFAALRHLKLICPNTPLICLSGGIGEEAAVELLKNGAVDYVSKDKMGRLIHSVERAIQEAKDQEELLEAQKSLIESAERLNLFFRQSLSGIFFMMIDEPIIWNDTVDKEKVLDYVFDHQRITKANQTMLNMYHLKEEEYLYKTPNQLIGVDIEAERKIWRNLFDKGHLHIDKWQTISNGERICIEGDYICLYDSQNRIIGHFGNQQDITQRKKAEEEREYLSYHDYLTGLYNRRFYEEELVRLDTRRNLPMTIAIGDVNGLKLINDSFGHAMGDELLVKVAKVIKNTCRADDIIARLGGDEFVIIFPDTTTTEAEKVILRIKEYTKQEKVGAIEISVSFGYETKYKVEENIQDIFSKTEDNMYRNKLFETSSMRSKTIDLIMNTLYEKNPREMLHSKRVSEICEAIASKMNLSEDVVKQLKITGLMHDIGKIGIDEKILNKPDKLTEEENKEIKKHSEIGYRILSSVNEFSEIALYVLEHQERWDGAGYPKGLKGEEISMQARIITIADSFDAMTSLRKYKDPISEKDAINEIIKCSGYQFDPKIAKVFVEQVMGKKWK